MKNVMLSVICLQLLAIGLLSVGCVSAPQYSCKASRGAVDLEGATVAVLPFNNYQSGKPDDRFSKSIQESLMVCVGSLKIIPLERAQQDRLRDEINFGFEGWCDEETAQRVGRLLGARVLLLGSIQQFGDRTRITGRFVETESGVIGKSAYVTGPASNSEAIIDKLATLLTSE